MLTIYVKSFGLDLVYLSLNQLDVILGKNWLEFNNVHINCFDKSMSFPEFAASDELLVYAKQVDEFMKDKGEVFMILPYMKDKRKDAIGELHVVCDSLEVFPDDISNFPLEGIVKFAIDLVTGISLVSMAPYGMLASKLSELKK